MALSVTYGPRSRLRVNGTRPAVCSTNARRGLRLLQTTRPQHVDVYNPFNGGVRARKPTEQRAGSSGFQRHGARSPGRGRWSLVVVGLMMTMMRPLIPANHPLRRNETWLMVSRERRRARTGSQSLHTGRGEPSPLYWEVYYFILGEYYLILGECYLILG